MQNGDIKNDQISASSYWNSYHHPSQGRLYFKASPPNQGSWSAGTSDLSQWLQIDLKQIVNVTRVATQGRNGWDQWVTLYKLEYSVDGVSFSYYTEEGKVKVIYDFIPTVINNRHFICRSLEIQFLRPKGFKRRSGNEFVHIKFVHIISIVS